MAPCLKKGFAIYKDTEEPQQTTIRKDTAGVKRDRHSPCHIKEENHLKKCLLPQAA